MKKYNKGWSLIEMLMVMSIGITLTAISVPSMAALIHQSEVSATRMMLVADLYFAKRMSIDRAVDVLVCKGDIHGCVKGTDWTAEGKGWIVCYNTGTVDESGMKQCDKPLADGSWPNPILVKQPSSQNVVLTGPEFPIVFHPTGALVSTPGQAKVIDISLKHAIDASQINIAATGVITHKAN